MARICLADPLLSPPPALRDALRLLLDRGGVAAVPTDTLYGLAANALDPAAVERVFILKGREAAKPLAVVVRDAAQAAELAAGLPPLFHPLAAAFWPGPLSLVVPARPDLPPALTAGTGTVAMRQPRLPFLAGLLQALAYPLTATSANLSAQPSCRTAAEVERQLGAALELIVDAGPSPQSLPSTLLDLTRTEPRILRHGAVPESALRSFWNSTPRSAPPPRV